ncbi:MAG: ABC transporter ATP-binding protein [Pseudomonadales bacterium]|jgi:oligopeptide/dipeptide ABC transporter ATP-binding protein|nr:ABC transporter ATP-binding protein [Pseudomonadales bacterium]
MNSTQYVLEVDNLAVEFDTYGGVVQAVRDVSFKLRKGKTLAIVGESGCGKSVTVQSLMGLIPMPPGRITRGSARLGGDELLHIAPAALNAIRGKRIGMIFQDPMSALNPTMSIGAQIAETLVVHRGMTASAARTEVLELLHLTQIPEPEQRLNQYPFECSGGMLQRAMIAMSIACKPEVLIADEPTTALDVTIQAQILLLLKQLQQSHGLSIILITHDLGVVAHMAHDVAVMYAGQVVESAPVDDLFYRPAHPYTLGLRAALPGNDPQKQRLQIIPGSPPDLFAPPPACAFADRCPHTMRLCRSAAPATYTRPPPPASQASTNSAHEARCWLHHPQAPSSPVRSSAAT